MSHKGEAYSASNAFFLDNPIRRWIQPPSELIGKLVIKPDDVAMDFGVGPGLLHCGACESSQIGGGG